LLNHLLTIEKFQLEILFHSSTIFHVVYSPSGEYFEDTEFLSSLLIFSNHLFEIFLGQEPDALDKESDRQVCPLSSPLSS
jgi:hypothetical protein